MDASKQASRQGNEKKQGRDDAKQGGDKGRLEGGRGSGQDRQSQGRQRDDETPATSQSGKGRRGAGEEE